MTQSFDEAVRFARQNGLAGLELRSVEDTAIDMLPAETLRAWRRRLDAEGLTVCGLAGSFYKCALEPDAVEAELAKLQADLKAQADGFAFDNALDTAILGKKGRSIKAVRALLDVDSLKGSADRTADIAKALDEAAKANPWAFGEDTPTPAPAPGYPVLPGGGEPRHLPSEKDGVTAAFMDRNPGLKI